MEPARILVADDRREVFEAVRLLLGPEGFEVVPAGSPAAVLESIGSSDHDLLLLDLNYARDTTSGREGLDLLARVRAIDATLPIVVMTAWATVDLAVEAMRKGARDFLAKPWENARLLATVRTQVELGRVLRRGERLEAELRVLRSDGAPRLLARSSAMRPVLERIERVGPSGAAVLITGEHGSGKGVVARALHDASPRAGRPLVVVNVGGLSEGVFESELFGHVRGAFTDASTDRVGRFELADGGTLFLDEIGNLSPAMQAKLLRVLESGEFERVGSSRSHRVNVRVIAATNADLAAEAAAGRFRPDLLYRLNTVEIRVPPLRERPEDIPLLAAYFLETHASRYHRPVEGFESAALDALVAHLWPGNVRELEHGIERAVLLAKGPLVRAGDLGLSHPSAPAAPTALEAMSLEDVERVLIRKALDRHAGNVSKAAEALGLSRSALYRRLQRHGL
ncbi:MAG TPA: sigma-54 dependent transcriptional regulator [Candidatus Polarisedimenticolaceae bacterium]